MFSYCVCPLLFLRSPPLYYQVVYRVWQVFSAPHYLRDGNIGLGGNLRIAVWLDVRDCTVVVPCIKVKYVFQVCPPCIQPFYNDMSPSQPHR